MASVTPRVTVYVVVDDYPYAPAFEGLYGTRADAEAAAAENHLCVIEFTIDSSGSVAEGGSFRG